MKKIAFIVDTSSGIKSGEYENVFVMPMIITATIDKKPITFYDQKDIDHEKLYSLLQQKVDIKTSQPNIGQLMALIEELEESYDLIIGLPIHPSLSATYQTWKSLEDEFSKFHAVKQYGIGFASKYIIETLIERAKKDDFDEIICSQIIEEMKEKLVGFLIVTNPEQLVKGGRVSNFKSLMIKLLSIKLVLCIDKNGLAFYGKDRTYDGCINIIKKGLKEKIGLDLTREQPEYAYSFLGNRDSKTNIDQMVKLFNENFELINNEPDHLPCVICSHTGNEYAAILIKRK